MLLYVADVLISPHPPLIYPFIHIHPLIMLVCRYVETMDGVRVEMGVGELSFGGDQACAVLGDGRTGHLSGCVGDVPTVLMLVQLNQTLAHAYPMLL